MPSLRLTLSPFCWEGVGWTEQKGLRVSLALSLVEQRQKTDILVAPLAANDCYTLMQ